ncbi:MAG: CHAD domain-containing protein [Sulfuricurvum sp.]
MRLNVLTQYLTYQLYHALTLLDALMQNRGSGDVHDFRIAIRRVRSVTALFLSGSVPFPSELKAAVKSTNPIRELDVLIESLKPKRYPKTCRTLSLLRGRHADAAFSPEFKTQTLNAIRNHYDTLCDADPDISSTHLIDTVERYYASALSDYGRICPETSQKELHRLRVRFKNARYGLEFLASSQLREEHRKIAECKKIQNRLGRVQDAYNQVEWLKKVYKRSPSSETAELLRERKKELKALKAASRSA